MAKLEAGIALLSERYAVRHTPRLLEREGFLAGSDRARVEELNLALASDTAAIYCARGGYGAMRILSRIDASLIERTSKPLIGFSDITALHALWQNLGVGSIHGPTLTQLPTLPLEDQLALYDLLEGQLPAPMSGTSIGSRTVAAGPLFGGNLELVSRLVGTPYAFSLAGAVLLLEEVGERPYSVDRSVTHLLLAGALDRLSAIVVGDLTRCTEPDGSGPSADEVIAERLGGLGIPVVVGLPIGHGTRNRSVGIGMQVSVDGTTGLVTPLAPATG